MASKKSNAPQESDSSTKSKIFSDVIIDNNKRLLIAFLTIAVLANIAVTGIKAAGIGSKYLEYEHIITEVLIVVVALTITIHFIEQV